MNIDPKKPFLNDLKKIASPMARAGIDHAVLTVKKALTMRDIPNLRKMRGCRKGIYYRIRVGDYRIGITVEGDLVTFARCLPRKDFYRHFP